MYIGIVMYIRIDIDTIHVRTAVAPGRPKGCLEDPVGASVVCLDAHQEQRVRWLSVLEKLEAERDSALRPWDGLGG